MLAVVDGYSLPEGVETCNIVGGPHGTNGIGIEFTPPNGMSQDPFHGSRKNCMTHNLASDEYITNWEAQTVKAKGGKETSRDDKKEGCEAPPDHQLGGFQGRSGAEIDAIGPIWVLVNPLKRADPDPPASDTPSAPPALDDPPASSAPPALDDPPASPAPPTLEYLLALDDPPASPTPSDQPNLLAPYYRPGPPYQADPTQPYTPYQFQPYTQIPLQYYQPASVQPYQPASVESYRPPQSYLPYQFVQTGQNNQQDQSSPEFDVMQKT
ncbi:Mannose-binding lectin [Plasmopara halstedii]|uniref:Mannose-binding lectin n=1 Tax=Plasmopara halstedii TaxID=4781 RepID=A0A0P1AYY7_PLAHL|nr:Mannose-binding lectin [Plasmopara halstedii]CEG47317.1 Mannose-binding lectin [Plasmopara halstedii]|eukprot:XP_024583686.1 Mannose-binding lectin [Plasmopara halstedii]